VTPTEIKANLLLKGKSLTDIKSEAGCSIQEVSMCISGKGLYQHVREIIAKYLGLEVHEIFNDICHPKPKQRNPRWYRVA